MLFAASAAILAVAGTSFVTTASAQTTLPATPDVVTSDNVEYLGSIKDDFGLTAGAKILGDRMFVTSGKNISIYDISDPAVPTRLGTMGVNVAWENEEVPTNGEVLAVASDFYNVMPSCLQEMAVTGCVQFFDVRDPANIKEIGSIPEANHTVECVLDCQYFYGRAGTIIDARGILDGEEPKVIGDWIDAVEAQGVEQNSCHHMRELRPGVLLTACRPFAVISVNAEDGGSPENPKVLASGEAAKFVHSARWPREGTDNLLMTGGEENFTGRCELNNSEFSTYDASGVNSGDTNQFQLIAQKSPTPNGTYTDGKTVAGGLGCSVHWFQEHPTFQNGGLVALSEYENGVRFLQIGEDGSITEQGYFLSLGGSSSSPKWAGKDEVLYSIDYNRGIDIMRWKGEHYVPGTDEAPSVVSGTNGTTEVPALNARQKLKLSQSARELSAVGWSAGLCRLTAQN
jgi:hypothetical protein